MAVLLVREYDNHRPEKSIRATVLSYRTNDPVVAVADGHVFTRKESDGSQFRRLLVPDMSLDAMRQFTAPETIEVMGFDDLIEQQPVARRLWSVDATRLPNTRAREYAAGETVLRDDEFLKAMVYKPLGLSAWAIGYRVS